METKNILDKIKKFFTKNDKAILGVCNNLSKKYSIKVLYLRVFFILSFFVLEIFSVIVYLLLFINSKFKIMYKFIFTIIGAILGLPLSYYFQPDIVQAKIGGIGGYIKNFGDIVNEKDLISNVIMGVVVFAIVGFVIGYFMDKNETTKIN